MKIVNIVGGLGNQMFQYAFYLALGRRYPAESVKIYTAAYNGYKPHNGYELEKVFGINPPEATILDVGRIAYPFDNYRQWQITNRILPKRRRMIRENIFGHYYDEVFSMEGDCFFDGYWQNERYFNEISKEILDLFTHVSVDGRNASLAAKMCALNSISIHVRRGDFTKNRIYRNVCGRDYYECAIKKMASKNNADLYCIFSDDIPWCENYLVPLLGNNEFVIVDWNTGNDAYLDMYLMSSCRHNIIANSSFSWWGAWLNRHPDKVVIGPRKWNNLNESEFTLPDKWIQL